MRRTGLWWCLALLLALACALPRPAAAQSIPGSPLTPNYVFFDSFTSAEDSTGKFQYFPSNGAMFVANADSARGPWPRFVTLAATSTVNSPGVSIRVYTKKASDTTNGYITVALLANERWTSDGNRVWRIELPTQAGWTAGLIKVSAVD